MRLWRMTMRKLLAMLGGCGSALLITAVCVFSCAVLQSVYHAKPSDRVRVAVVMSDHVYADDLLSRLNENDGILADIFEPDEADDALLADRVDGVLTLLDGFSLSASDAEERLSYRSSPQSSAFAYVLTRVYSAIMTARIRQAVVDEVAQRYSDADLVVQEAWQRVEAEQPGCTLRISSDGGESYLGGQYVLSGLSGGIQGFIAMLLMFLYVSMLQWLLQEDVKRVSERMSSLDCGRCMGIATDFLALVIAGFLIGAGCSLASDELTGRTLANLAAYCACLSGLMLLLSGAVKRDGEVQMAVPFLTLFTSILGGCLFDLSVVSTWFAKFSMITPQGWYLSGVSGESAVPGCILLAVGLGGFLISLSVHPRQ